MAGTRYEEYGQQADGLPFVLYAGLHRASDCNSEESNWHEDLEIQICTEGEGTVWLDGQPLALRPGDMAVIPSHVIHHTVTATTLTYSALIVRLDFCRQMGLDPAGLDFSPLVQDTALSALLLQLISLYAQQDAPCRIARLHHLLLGILIDAAGRHATPKRSVPSGRGAEPVRRTMSYIRQNYARHLTLDEIARAALYDKYALCREFRRMTGQTMIQYINKYRCMQAIAYLRAGSTVAEAAAQCGFDNLSFFTRIFRRYTGRLPSSYK